MQVMLTTYLVWIIWCRPLLAFFRLSYEGVPKLAGMVLAFFRRVNSTFGKLRFSSSFATHSLSLRQQSATGNNQTKQLLLLCIACTQNWLAKTCYLCWNLYGASASRISSGTGTLLSIVAHVFFETPAGRNGGSLSSPFMAFPPLSSLTLKSKAMLF